MNAVICVAAYRDVSIPTTMVLLEAYKTGKYDVIFQWNDSLLPRSRSRLAYRFLKDFPDSDVMVFVDTDGAFPVQALNEIVHHARTKKAIVGLPFAMRGSGKANFTTVEDAVDLPSDRPVEVHTIGLACTAIHRDVINAAIKSAQDYPRGIELIQDTEFPFWDIFPVDYHDGGEDATFCIQARYNGFKVYVLPRYQTSHYGTYAYRISPTKGFRQ